MLEEGITGIECKELFSGCINLNSVEFPDSLTQIQEGAFKYCDGLTIVTIPENVTFIGGNVFDKCKNLRDVVIKSKDVHIGAAAFGWNDSNTPGTSERIANFSVFCYEGATAIEHCDKEKLTYTVITPEEADWKRGSIGDNVNDVLKWSLDNEGTLRITGTGTAGRINDMDSVKRVIFGEGITRIGVDSFKNLTGIESVEFPSTLDSIGGEAFYGCSGLKEITIPENTTSIGAWSFNCDNLATVSILSKDVSIGETPFGFTNQLDETQHYIPVENFTIIGYKGSTAEEYANKHDYWKFIDIEHKDDPVIKGDVNGDGAVTVTDISKDAAHVKGIRALEADEEARADVNEDGTVTVTDISKLAAHVKGTRTLE